MTLRKEWTFEEHLSVTQSFLNGRAENDHSWICEAQRTHALTVLQAAMDQHIQVVSFAQSLNESRLKSLIMYGLGRRTRSLWVNFRRIYVEIEPNRSNPLLADENTELSDAINSTYINIRGTLDLVAASIHQVCFPGIKLHDSAISLFDQRWAKNLAESDFKSNLKSHESWFYEMKNRRDPAAHRIPLSFVPAILNKIEIAKRDDLVRKANTLSTCIQTQPQEKVEKLQEEISQIFQQIEKLGSFLPLFTFDEACQPIALYPTLTIDVANCIEVLIAGLDHIKKSALSPTSQTSYT